jgi:hypothetical protein
LVSNAFWGSYKVFSSGEICAGMVGMEGKHNYLELNSEPAKSTFCDELRERTKKTLVQIYNFLALNGGKFFKLMK